MRTCIAWDGHVLACPVSSPSSNGTDGITTDLFNHSIHDAKYHVFPDSHWGTLRALGVAAPMSHYRQIRSFLEERPLEELIEFYQRAARYGLLGKKLQFLVLAVTDATVIAVSVKSASCSVTYDVREKPTAIGKDALTALMLMRVGAPANVACGVQLLTADKADASLRINAVCDFPNLNVRHIPPRTPEPWHRQALTICTRDLIDSYLSNGGASALVVNS